MFRSPAAVASVGVAVGAVLYHAMGAVIRRGRKPVLYVYDHCPFSVRARVILGLKKIDYHLVVMESHDYETPTQLVGAKQAPILQFSNGKTMAESMDIVRFVDQNWGGAPILAESAVRPELKQWIQDTQPLLNQLYIPRFHQQYLPEFLRKASRDYYKESKEKSVGKLDTLWKNSPQLMTKLEGQLHKLEPLLFSDKSVNRKLSYDDVDIFGRLRGLSIIKDLKIPPKVIKYLRHFSTQADIAMYDRLAC